LDGAAYRRNGCGLPEKKVARQVVAINLTLVGAALGVDVGL
jgi:hypothetical protein